MCSGFNRMESQPIRARYSRAILQEMLTGCLISLWEDVAWSPRYSRGGYLKSNRP